MTHFSVENAEATELVSVDGEEAPVHHCRIPNADPQEIVDWFDEVPTESAAGDERLLKDAPAIATEVCELTTPGFATTVELSDRFDADVRTAAANVYEYFDYEADSWEASAYDATDPTRADVLAAAASMANAAWCVDRFRDAVVESDGSRPLLSEEFFDARVVQGLCLCFRDAHMTNAPRPALQGMFFNDFTEATREAISNVLSVELTDAELHGLLLSRGNQSVLLEEASSQGKQKMADEAVNVVENLTNTSGEGED